MKKPYKDFFCDRFWPWKEKGHVSKEKLMYYGRFSHQLCATSRSLTGNCFHLELRLTLLKDKPIQRRSIQEFLLSSLNNSFKLHSVMLWLDIKSAFTPTKKLQFIGTIGGAKLTLRFKQIASCRIPCTCQIIKQSISSLNWNSKFLPVLIYTLENLYR